MFRTKPDYFVVVVVVVADGVVVVTDGDIGELVVVVDGAPVVVVDVVVSAGFDASGTATGTTVVVGGGVLTTGGGLLTTVGFSHAATANTASDPTNNIEYFMFILLIQRMRPGVGPLKNRCLQRRDPTIAKHFARTPRSRAIDYG